MQYLVMQTELVSSPSQKFTTNFRTASPYSTLNFTDYFKTHLWMPPCLKYLSGLKKPHLCIYLHFITAHSIWLLNTNSCNFILLGSFICAEILVPKTSEHTQFTVPLNPSDVSIILENTNSQGQHTEAIQLQRLFF